MDPEVMVTWSGVCPVQGYYFNTNNPYQDWPNAFAEGQEKAREGDLNAAVLLLEAAILQDPQDSEVRPEHQLMCPHTVWDRGWTGSDVTVGGAAPSPGLLEFILFF